jgi:hypothetical protein
MSNCLLKSRDRQGLTLAVWLSSREMSAACHEYSAILGSRDIMFPFLSFSLYTLPVQLPPPPPPPIPPFPPRSHHFCLVFQRTSRNKPIYSAEKGMNEVKDGMGRERRFKKCKSMARTVCHCQSIITRQRGTTSGARLVQCRG